MRRATKLLWIGLTATMVACGAHPIMPVVATPPATSAAATEPAPIAPPAPSAIEAPPETSPPLTTAPTRSTAALGEPPPGVPAALYAGLFEKGRGWRLVGKEKHGSYDTRPRSTQAAFQARCAVKTVQRMTWGVMSEIACEGFPSIPSDDPLSGVWIATADGLFHPQEQPKGPFEPGKHDLVIESAPKAVAKESREPKEPQFGSLRKVVRRGAGWCADDSSWGGDEGWRGICLDPKAGITAGRWGWAGGSTHEAEFTATAAK